MPTAISPLVRDVGNLAEPIVGRHLFRLLKHVLYGSGAAERRRLWCPVVCCAVALGGVDERAEYQGYLPVVLQCHASEGRL